MGHADSGRPAVQRAGHLGGHGALSHVGDAGLSLGEHQVSGDGWSVTGWPSVCIL